MTKLLANLLQQDKNNFKKYIYDLESTTGHMRTDLKLLSNIKIKSNIKLKCLGLDPENTKSKELYFSLLNLASLHDSFLLKKYSSIDNALVNMVKRLSKISGTHNTTVVSHKSLKAIFHSVPPKRTMKIMRYRSLESMLKREDLDLVVNLSLELESNSWIREFMDLISRLEPKDFVDEKMRVVLLNDLRYKKISQSLINTKNSNVKYSHLVSRIYVLPIDGTYVEGTYLLTTGLVIEALKELILANIFLGAIRFNNDFARVLVDIVNDNYSTGMYLSKYELNWRVVSKFKMLNPDFNDDILVGNFEKEITNRYLEIDRQIYQLEPALHFWYMADYLGYIESNRVVSLNMLDNCFNLVNKLSFKNRSAFFMSKSLEEEIYLNYLGLESINPQINNQLMDATDSSSHINIINRGIVYT